MVSEGDEASKTDSKPDETKLKRRNFLGSALAFSIVLLVAGIAGVTRVLSAPAAPEPSGTTPTRTTTTGTGFPRVKVANLSDLKLNTPLSFNYPLEETPNFLLKLGTKVDGGVGPDSDIVAYSYICQHLGCFWGFVAPGATAACNSKYTATGPVGYCCCHGSVFDLAKGGVVVSGPSPRPQPAVILEFDGSSGDIFATGMTPPTIFGHNTGSSDVSADLQGGTRVA